MTARTFARRAAVMLMDRATLMLPADRHEWGEAMRAELQHIQKDRSAFLWAAGCLLAGFTERYRTMKTSNHGIPRWLLTMEWLVCFGPLTLLWIVAMAFIITGRLNTADLLFSTAVASIGPVTLILAFAFTAFSKPLRQQWLLNILLAGFAGLGLLQLMAMSKNGGFRWFEFDWKLVALCSILPLIGCAHLRYLSRHPAGASGGPASIPS